MRISPFIRPTLTLAGLGFFMLTGCYGANWLLNLPFISGLANIFVGVGFSVAFSKAAFLSLSLFYGKQGIQLVYSLYTRIKMRFFEGNQLEKAKNIWQTFNQKYQSLTGDQSEFRDRFTKLSDLNLEELQHQDPKKYEVFEKAATKIARFWKKKRISGDFISVNPNGNHSDQFHTLLNVNKKGQIDQRIKKRLSYFQDQALLNDIQTANWNASRFRKGETHHSAFSLFASNKIDFHQKSTVSDIIETAAVFGDFVAYPILDQHGQFTKEAKQYLLPELRGSKLAGLVRKFNTRDMENFRNLVQCLPRSEQFIFVFKNQKTVDGQHLPSSDKSEFRVQLATTAPYWLLNAEVRIEKTVPNWAKPVFRYILGYVANIFPIPFNYDGVLKLSFGARNAMGLALYGKEWEPLIPRIGRQSIDDIEHFSKQFSRPGPSPESYHFGIVPSNENLHSITVEYTESIAHDDYHRTKRSIENHESKMAIEQLIAIARKTFGFKWSKDLWLLRDFDLVAIPISVPELFYQSSFIKWIYPKAYHTSNFSRLLRFIYLPNQLENCDQLTQHLRGRALMFDVDGKPNQILQLLAIDLILNPKRWSQYHIVSNPRYFGGAFQEVLKIAHYLNQHGVFNKNDMKLNIIRFNTYLKNETPIVIREGNLAASKAWQAPKMPLHDSGLASAKAITENKASKYQAHRDNKIVFLGFMLPKQIEASKPRNNSASAFDWLARSTYLRRF